MSWASATRLTVVLVTHDPAIAARAPRVVRMRRGELSDVTTW